MHLLAITGFLGSGKTTLIRGLARCLVDERGLRVAVLENELGEVGVDGQVLGQGAVVVKQLSGGCFCCTLRGDVAAALAELVRDHAPDVIIIEPSGAAGPDVAANLMEVAGSDCPLQAVAIFDATRLHLIHGANPYLVSGLLGHAAVGVLTKCDKVPAERIVECRAMLQEEDPRPPLLCLDGRTPGAAAAVLALLDEARGAPPLAIARGRTTPLPAAVARTVRLTSPRSGNSLKSAVSAVLDDLAAGLPRPGDGVLGHLKAFIDAAGDGWCYLSTTGLASGVHDEGRLAATVSSATITVNAIVQGVDAEVLGQLCDQALTRLGGARRIPLFPLRR